MPVEFLCNPYMIYRPYLILYILPIFYILPEAGSGTHCFCARELFSLEESVPQPSPGPPKVCRIITCFAVMMGGKHEYVSLEGILTLTFCAARFCCSKHGPLWLLKTSSFSKHAKFRSTWACHWKTDQDRSHLSVKNTCRRM